MRNEPAGLTRAQLTKALAAHWGLDANSLEYAPVGFGSYHWLATDAAGRCWFVTADHLTNLGTFEGSADAAFTRFDAAMQTSARVFDEGLEFALAPVRTRQGDVLARVSKEWCLAVFPLIEGAEEGPWTWVSSSARNVAAGLVGRLHAIAPPHTAVQWTPALPYRSALEAALDDLTQPWSTGPYAEPTRLLLADAQSQLRVTFAAYDALADTVMQSSEPWVVTHGEPHSANFITRPNGEMLLIDWETVLLGPRERDLWLVVGDDPAALAAYEQAGAYRPDHRAMELFRVRWLLTDVAICIRRFRSPHDDSLDDRAIWDALEETVRDMTERPVDV